MGIFSRSVLYATRLRTVPRRVTNLLDSCVCTWGAVAWCPAFSGARDRRAVVRAEGVEPTRAVKPCGFSCRLRLSPPGRGRLERSRQVCGLDYPFTVPRKFRDLWLSACADVQVGQCFIGSRSGWEVSRLWPRLSVAGFKRAKAAFSRTGSSKRLPGQPQATGCVIGTLLRTARRQDCRRNDPPHCTCQAGSLDPR